MSRTSECEDREVKRIVDFAASTCSNAQERKEIEASLLPGKEQFKVAELGERLKDLNELILAKVRDGIALVVQKETLNAISLDLADRKIGSKQAPFLASLLPTMPLLEVLDLSALDLDDEDLAKVIRSIGMSSIRKLIISASRIGADQSSILADVLVGPSKQLTSLIADSTGLADKGAAAFAKKLQTAETSMTSLNLSSNMNKQKVCVNWRRLCKKTSRLPSCFWMTILSVTATTRRDGSPS